MFKKIKYQLFIHLPKIITGEKKNFFSPLVLAFLRFCSWGYRFAHWIKNKKDQKNREKKFSPCIVSIGNIVAGGTGKTPLTAYFCETFLQKNRTFGIISRGYGSKFEKSFFHIDEKNKNFSWKDVGDESYFFAKKFPKVNIFIGKNRLFSVKYAEDKKIDLLFLDDGLQYRKLHRDFEIIVLNANDLFGQNFFLPRGFLRDSPKRLEGADLIVINHVYSQKQFSKIKDQINQYSNAPVVGMHPKCISIKDHKGKGIDLTKKKVIAFCSIAHPNTFFQLLENQMINIIQKFAFADHQPIDFQKVENGLQADYYICTEKDFVKLDRKFVNSYPIATLEMGLSIIFGKQHLENMVEKINKKRNNAHSANK